MKTVLLKDICKPKQWKTIPVSKLKDKGYPVYGANGIIGYWHEYNHEKPTILVTCRGATCGEINVSSPKSYITGNAMCLDGLDKNYSLDFIEAFLRAYDFGKVISGTAQPQITKSGIGQIPIPILSLSEQKILTERFRRILKLISLGKNALKIYDDLVKSRFIEMFGDPEAPDFPYMMVELGDVLRKPASNGFFAKRKDYVEDGNVEILGVANVVNRMYSGIDNLPKTNGTSADIEKYSLSYGDMLFCRSSLVLEGIGKASIVPREVRPNTLFECHVIRMPLDISVCVPEFMQLQSTLPAFRKQVMTKAKTATMTTIDQKSLLSIKVFLPPIEEQKYFLSFIEQVDKLKFDLGICLFILREETFRLSG